MFFPMLRRQAKWVFVLLALVFAGGFVFFGVGSGSNGIGDMLQNWLNLGGGSSGPSVASLQAKAQAHPRDAKAFRDLATAYETKQDTGGAISALERFTALRPKNQDALQELAGLYQRKAQDLSVQYQTAAASDPFGGAGNPFAPPPTTKLGEAFQSPSMLGDPIQQAITSLASQRQSDLATQIRSVSAKEYATYKKLVRLDPSEPTLQLQLGQAAQVNGDTAGAIAAYEKFLKLSPDDPLAPQVKQVLKQLKPAPAKSASPASKKPAQGKQGG
jgi:tetratricopeptide (TPR) repeat protein